MPADGAASSPTRSTRSRQTPSLGEDVFILTYDENDGLFDHVAPVPPEVRRGRGGLPIGAGYRIPTIVVSP